MKVTIKDIAKQAGVSIATVSNVFNHKKNKISSETEQRVLTIAKELNYVHNSIASAMVTKRTGMIGLLIPSISNPFFPEVARGVEDYANENDYYVILCNFDNHVDKEVKYLEMLKSKMVDGIIYISSNVQRAKPEIFTHLNIPLITMDRELNGVESSDIIVIDNQKAAFDATNYLLDCGRKSLVHISGPMESKTALDRYSGFVKAHKSRGVKLMDHHYIKGDYTLDSGALAVETLLKEAIDFDGIFCSNDLMAIGVLEALKKNAIAVPKQVSVVGFDDIEIASIVSPKLTTVHQPKYEMGRKACEVLIQRIENKSTLCDKIILDTKLVIRESA